MAQLQLSHCLQDAAQALAGAAQAVQAAPAVVQAPAPGAAFSQQQLQQLQQLIAQAITPLQQSVDNIGRDMVAVKAMAARASNASVLYGGALEAVPCTVQGPHFGQSPPSFPATTQQLQRLRSAQLTALLNFYGQPVAGTDAEKRVQLARYLGIKVEV